jgi:hypothetical protein
MARNPAAFARRQRELERQKKKREKQAERQERREQRKSAEAVDDPMQDPTIDWAQSVREVEVDEAEVHQQVHDEAIDEKE